MCISFVFYPGKDGKHIKYLSLRFGDPLVPTVLRLARDAMAPDHHSYAGVSEYKNR